MPRQPHIPHCPSHHHFNTCAVGLLRQLRAIDHTYCDRAQCGQTHSTLSNVHDFAIERPDYDRVHSGLRSSALTTIKRTPDLAAHLFLSINRTLCNFIWFYVWRPPWRPETYLFITVNPLNCHFILLLYFCLLIVSLFSMGG